MSNDNSGPAFPTKGGMIFYVPEHIQDSVKEDINALKQETEGMTKLEYYAAHCPFTLKDYTELLKSIGGKTEGFSILEILTGYAELRFKYGATMTSVNQHEILEELEEAKAPEQPI